MIIQGYIPSWSHAEGMTGYLKANSIRIFDFSNFSQPLTEQVRSNAQRIADENGIDIEFIRKLRAFRKDDRIQEFEIEMPLFGTIFTGQGYLMLNKSLGNRIGKGVV